MFSSLVNFWKNVSHAPDLEQELAYLRARSDDFDDRLLGLQAQIAHEEGYIGVEATKRFFEQNGITLD